MMGSINNDNINAKKAKANLSWADVNWAEIEVYVFNIQKSIYNESKNGNKVRVHALQKELTKSIEARLLAIRKVT